MTESFCNNWDRNGFLDNHGWVFTDTRTYAKQDTISTRYETKYEFDGRGTSL